MSDRYEHDLRRRDQCEDAKDRAEAKARAVFDTVLRTSPHGIFLDGLKEALEEYANAVDALADAQDEFDVTSGAWDEPDD